jgi:hypothetical protein
MSNESRNAKIEMNVDGDKADDGAPSAVFFLSGFDFPSSFEFRHSLLLEDRSS